MFLGVVQVQGQILEVWASHGMQTYGVSEVCKLNVPANLKTNVDMNTSQFNSRSVGLLLILIFRS